MNAPTDSDRESPVSLVAMDSGVFDRRSVNRKRHRVTIDLRGIGSRLDAHVAGRGKTMATVVRAAVVAMLDAEGAVEPPDRFVAQDNARAAKVTVRMSVFHAVRLSHCARRVGVSQGTYLEGLLDGQPLAPKSADHGTAVSALAESTQTVAAMSTDIRALIRFVSQGEVEEAQKYRKTLLSLDQEVRLHLESASRLMAGLTSRMPSTGSEKIRSRRSGAST